MKLSLKGSLQLSYRCIYSSLPQSALCCSNSTKKPLLYTFSACHHTTSSGKHTSSILSSSRNAHPTLPKTQTLRQHKHLHSCVNSTRSQHISDGFQTTTLKNVNRRHQSQSSSTAGSSNDRDKDAALRSSNVNNSHTDHGGIVDRYIYVKTLNTLYEDITNGVILDTAYGDSRPNADHDPTVPVVVALHDTPGCHTDLVPLLSFFAKLGCRTICPTFPGHGNTRGIMRNYDDIFSQSTMERATFVHDFLIDLDVRRVDVLIGVGAASYTVMALCTRRAEMYKSMALLSPWPLTQPRYSVDSKMLKHVHEFWEMVYFRPAMRLLLPLFNIGRAKTPDEKIAACYLAQNIDLGEADSFALTASMRDMPCLVAYGGQDDVVSEELYADLLSKLGLNSSHVVSDHQGGPSHDVAKQQQPTVLRIPNSGYDDIVTHHRGVLCAHILRLLQRFHPSVKI